MKYKQFLWMIPLLYIACSTKTEKGNSEKVPATLNSYFNAEWANNKLWYDGLAEVATYNAQRTVYNKERNFEYTYITVAEDFNREFRVKTDDYERNDLYKVMKVNAFCKIETENYPYHYLTSMFFYFDKPWSMDKMTSSSQEWCGNTFKEYLNNGENYLLNYHSYFDGEGDGEKQISTEVLFEDQLNYSLRSLNFKNKLSFKAQVLESQISSKVGELKTYHAVISVEDGLQEIPDQNSWKISVKLQEGKINTYFFDKTYPNVLLQQQTWDNRNLTLKKTSRYAYWKH